MAGKKCEGEEGHGEMLSKSGNVKAGTHKALSANILIIFLLFEQVFFTRNGKMVGRSEVALPEGGFYPTIGMMTTGEKVRVDLCPLSG